jgi:hypothetical protein
MSKLQIYRADGAGEFQPGNGQVGLDAVKKTDFNHNVL